MANITFEERMRRARIRNAMSQGDLAEKFGVGGRFKGNGPNVDTDERAGAFRRFER
jgi:hypothetical protein